MEAALKQYLLTPSAGKRLIAKGMANHPAVAAALQSGTLVIVAGTTNGYVAEEILASLGQSDAFSRSSFFRGITLPPGRPMTEMGMLPDQKGFPGDVVIAKGVWQPGQTIFDAVDGLKEGDVILKGANAVDVHARKAAVYIGHPKAGTIGVALQAMVGRRVRVILPVGLEKRITGNLDDLARKLNAPGAKGPRLLPVEADIFTELDAVQLLTGAAADLVAAGGVGGAEGSCWLAVTGTPDQLHAADAVLRSVAREQPFQV